MVKMVAERPLDVLGGYLLQLSMADYIKFTSIY